MLGLVTFFSILLVLAIGIWRKPAVAFAGVLCMYGLKQWGQASSAVLSEHRTIANISIGSLVVIGLVRLLAQDVARLRIVPRTLIWGMVLFLYSFVTLAWSPIFDVAIEQWQLASVYILMIAVFAPFLLNDAEEVRRMCTWTVAVGGAICALVFFFGSWGPRGLIILGSHLVKYEANPLAIASLGGTLTVMGAVSLASPQPLLKKVLFTVVVPLGITVILRSGSRGQLVAALIAVLIGLPLASRKLNMGAWLAGAIILGLFAQTGWWIWEHLGVTSHRWTDAQSIEDVEGRITMAAGLLSAWVSDPFTLIFGLSNSSSFYYIGIYPHITPLEVLAEEGLVGIAIYSVMLIAAFRSMVKVWSHSRSLPTAEPQHAVAVLSALFIFEWILTLKQGQLISSAYVIAYAVVIERLARTISERMVATNGMLKTAPSKLPNLMGYG